LAGSPRGLAGGGRGAEKRNQGPPLGRGTVPSQPANRIKAEQKRG